jgi:AraC-like DNA-binding protein
MDVFVLDNPEGPVFTKECDTIRFGKFESLAITTEGNEDQLILQNLYLPNITVKYFDGTFGHDTRLVNKNNVGSDLIGFCFFLKGGLTTNFPTASKAMQIKGGDQKLKFDPNSEMTHVVPGSRSLEFVHMSVHPEYFFNLLPEHEGWSEDLREHIGTGRVLFRETASSLSLIQQMALQQIIRSPYDGKLGRLMLESYVVQVILNLLQESFNRPETHPTRLSKRDRDLMHDVRDFLLDTFLELHSLNGLSRQFGVNQTKLVAGFKAEFGTTIFEYIGGLKLQHAKKLLEEDGFFVQEVSSIVGYKNPNHFSAAFKKKFGFSPSLIKS